MGNQIQNQNNQVEPYSLGVTIGIIVVLALFDTVGCVILTIGAYIFTKKGHAGLGIALVITNFIIPDMLPYVDELFGIVAFVVPFMQSRKQGKGVIESAKAGMNSAKQYQQTSNNYIRKSEEVKNKIGIPSNQSVDNGGEYYGDNNYYDES